MSVNHDDLWREHAACRTHLRLWLWWGLSVSFELDLNLFFPEDGHKEQAALARRFCDLCPVAEDCLEYALVHFIRDGIWGGTSERQRRVLQRARRRPEGVAG